MEGGEVAGEDNSASSFNRLSSLLLLLECSICVPLLLCSFAVALGSILPLELPRHARRPILLQVLILLRALPFLRCLAMQAQW